MSELDWLDIVVLLAVVGLAVLVVQAYMRLRGMRARVNRLAADLDNADAEVQRALADTGGRRLVIDVLNPLAVARANSRVGAQVAGVAPGLVRNRVYEEIQRELGEQLSERGIDAEIEIVSGMRTS